MHTAGGFQTCHLVGFDSLAMRKPRACFCDMNTSILLFFIGAAIVVLLVSTVSRTTP